MAIKVERLILVDPGSERGSASGSKYVLTGYCLPKRKSRPGVQVHSNGDRRVLIAAKLTNERLLIR